MTVETAGTDSDETAGAEETRTGTEEIHQIGRRRDYHLLLLTFRPVFVNSKQIHTYSLTETLSKRQDFGRVKSSLISEVLSYFGKTGLS